MHQLLVAEHYPGVIDVDGIRVRCNDYWRTADFSGGCQRQTTDYDDYLIEQVGKITGKIQGGPMTQSDDDPKKSYRVQYNFYRKGSFLRPHIDVQTKWSAIVQLRGKKKLEFYKVKHQEGSTLLKDSTLLESVSMSPGDIIVIDMVKSRDGLIGHGVPECDSYSATAVLRD